MENILVNILLYMVILICLLLTFLGMMGNVWLLLSAGFYAVQEDFVKFNEEFLLFLFLVFAAGEIWEFFVSFFGIKRKDVSWFTVFIVGVGALFGVIVGTAVLPLFGSVVGGALGAGIAAFAIEYARNRNRKDAWRLALLALKTQLLAVLGKITAGVIMACMMVLQSLK